MSKSQNDNTDGLVQDCSNSSALAMELLQFYTKPSIYHHDYRHGLALNWCKPITWTNDGSIHLH